MNYAFAKYMLFAGFLTLAYSTASAFVVINLTPSYPQGVYLLSKTDLCVGDLIWFDDPSGLAVERSYIPRDARLMKEIVATQGEGYCVQEELTVGENSFGPVHAVDTFGRPLQRHPGCRVVPDRHVLGASLADKSYDSRYFGPIPIGVIHGKLEALWIW